MKPLLVFTEDDWPDDFKVTLKAVIRELDLNLGPVNITDEMTSIGSNVIKAYVRDSLVLVIGKPTAELLESGVKLCPGPSIAQVLGTPHGLERLRRSLKLWQMMTEGTVEDPLYQYDLVEPNDSFKGSPTGYRSKMQQYFATMSHDYLVVDIEVSGDITEDEPEDTELLSVAVLFPKRGTDEYSIVVWTKEALADEYCRIRLAMILSSGVPLLLHNGQFDVKWVNNRLEHELQGCVVKPTIDTILKHHAMFPGATGDHSLKPLAQKLLGAPEWEKDIRKYTIAGAYYERIPSNLLYSYNAADVYWTWKLNQLFDMWLDEGPAGPRKLLAETTVPASRMFVDIESTKAGWPVDLAHLKNLESDLTKKATKQLTKFRMAVGDPTPYLSEANAKQRALWLSKGTPLRDKSHEFNPSSWQQVQKYLAAQGVHLLSTGEEVLREYLENGVDGRGASYNHAPPKKIEKFLTRLLDYRHTTKMCSNYATGVLKKQRNGSVRPRFNVAGTVTGRLASWIHTVPRVTGDNGADAVYRAAYTAGGPDWRVCGVDYGQIELRIVAELCGDPQMIEDLQEDKPDFFSVLMPGCFPSMFNNLADVWKFKEAESGPYKAMRNEVKPIVHGANYMRQPAAMAKQLGISLKQAYTMYNYYMERYPLLREWQEETMAYVRGEAIDPMWGVPGLWTPFGRHFQQGVITDKNSWSIKNAAIAFKPQAIGSDICLTAAIELHEILHFYNARLVNSQHDALYAIAPVDQAEAVLKKMQTVMRASAAKIFSRVPFITEGHIGSDWSTV